MSAGGEKPKFAVRIERGLVTHWGDRPLTTRELAEACREMIWQTVGEYGAIEDIVAVVEVSA